MGTHYDHSINLMVVSVNRIKKQTGQVNTLVNETYQFAQHKFRFLNKSSKANIRVVLQSWIASNPWEKRGSPIKLGSIKPTMGLSSTEPKAWWKGFASEDEFRLHLTYEADKRVLSNRETERNLANELLAHGPTAEALNDLRRALGTHFWNLDGTKGKISHYLSTYTPVNLLPNWTGSYNEANSYPAYKKTPVEYMEWDTNDTYMMNLVSSVFWDYLTRSKDRLSLMFDERDFSVSENIAILHDIKELFSPKGNSRGFGTWHTQLVPHPYQGAGSPDRPMRWNDDGDRRIEVKKKDFTAQRPLPRRSPTEIKWDQGRKGAGTRNEESPDTKTARKNLMPIETGRSHTAARLFEMVTLLKPGNLAPRHEEQLFARRVKAMAYGIFGYWNGDDGYPKMLTPVHTYHEVMDPAEDYLPDIYESPFSYEDIKGYLRARHPRISSIGANPGEAEQWQTFEAHAASFASTGSFPNPSSPEASYAVQTFNANNYVAPLWLSSARDAVRRLNGRVKWISNEGWYVDTNGSVQKQLNNTHIATDFVESYQVGHGQVSYEGAFEYMHILPKMNGQTRLIGANGFPLPPGSYMFTIGDDAKLRYFPTDNKLAERGQKLKHFAQYLPHAALAGRASLYAAGNFGIAERGALEWVASTSGHYRIEDTMCNHNFGATLVALGYTYDSRVYKNYNLARAFFAARKRGMKILLDTRPKATDTTRSIKAALTAVKTWNPY